MLSESLIRLDWIAWSARIGPLAADSESLDRDRGRMLPHRALCVTYANSDPRRLTVAHPPYRNPLVRTRHISLLAIGLGLQSNRRCLPRCIRARCRQPKSSTRSLTGCHSPPSVQIPPSTLFHNASSRSDRRARCLRQLLSESSQSPGRINPSFSGVLVDTRLRNTRVSWRIQLRPRLCYWRNRHLEEPGRMLLFRES